MIFGNHDNPVKIKLITLVFAILANKVDMCINHIPVAITFLWWLQFGTCIRQCFSTLWSCFPQLHANSKYRSWPSTKTNWKNITIQNWHIKVILMSCLITCNPQVISKQRYELFKLEQNNFSMTERLKISLPRQRYVSIWICQVQAFST